MDAQLTARAPKANRSKAKDDKPPGFSTDIVEECLRKYATPADREKLKDLKPFMFAALPESVLRAMQLSERLIQAHSETTKTLSRWLVNYSAARGASGSGGGDDDDDDDDDDALPSKRSKSPDTPDRTGVLAKSCFALLGVQAGATCCPRLSRTERREVELKRAIPVRHLPCETSLPRERNEQGRVQDRGTSSKTVGARRDPAERRHKQTLRL
ncbi:hypothetical protein Q5P01_001009 [Channa striata]|uniref:Uncharacterized protein n=1 Tax=Channa striata TaxID=64152 RepID=A0AA88IIX5_CHASR|nr:hypothetical protein Q5P01_001009 [Channa striata]